jgi:hypothetical protein
LLLGPAALEVLDMPVLDIFEAFILLACDILLCIIFDCMLLADPGRAIT